MRCLARATDPTVPANDLVAAVHAMDVPSPRQEGPRHYMRLTVGSLSLQCSFVQMPILHNSLFPFSSQGCDTVAQLMVPATKITPDVDTRYACAKVACERLSTYQSPGSWCPTCKDCLWSEVLPSLQRRHGWLHLFRRGSRSRLSVLDERMTKSIIRGNPPGRIKLQTLLQQVDEVMHLL